MRSCVTAFDRKQRAMATATIDDEHCCRSEPALWCIEDDHVVVGAVAPSRAGTSFGKAVGLDGVTVMRL